MPVTVDRRGPGRPSKGPRAKVLARVPVDIRNDMVRMAQRRGETITDLIVRLIREELSREVAA